MSNADALNYYASLKRGTIAKLEHLKSRDLKHQKEIELSESIQLDFLKPGVYRQDIPDNKVNDMELRFEKMCAMLETEGVKDPHLKTVFSFYSTIAYFKGRKKPGKNGKPR